MTEDEAKGNSMTDPRYVTKDGVPYKEGMTLYVPIDNSEGFDSLPNYKIITVRDTYLKHGVVTFDSENGSTSYGTPNVYYANRENAAREIVAKLNSLETHYRTLAEQTARMAAKFEAEYAD